jgi:hypothetical protein
LPQGHQQTVPQRMPQRFELRGLAQHQFLVTGGHPESIQEIRLLSKRRKC